MQRGFTLIEMMMVLGLGAVIATFSLYEGIGSFQYQLNQSTNAHVDTLRAMAREETLQHLCFGGSCTGPAPHDVYLGNKELILFQGNSFVTRDAEQDWTLPL